VGGRPSLRLCGSGGSPERGEHRAGKGVGDQLGCSGGFVPGAWPAVPGCRFRPGQGSQGQQRGGDLEGAVGEETATQLVPAMLRARVLPGSGRRPAARYGEAEFPVGTRLLTRGGLGAEPVRQGKAPARGGLTARGQRSGRC